MWWPAETEIKAEEFNTINFYEAGLSAMQVSWCKTLIYVPDRSLYISQGEDNKSTKHAQNSMISLGSMRRNF